MPDLTGKLHCPWCGTTDPARWHQSVGSPEVYCSDDAVLLVEECGIECDHIETDEELNWILAGRPEPRKWEYPIGGCTIGDQTHQDGVQPSARELFTDASPFHPAPAWLAQSGHPWLTGHGI